VGPIPSQNLRSNHHAEANPVQGKSNQETKINLDQTCDAFYKVHPEKRREYDQGTFNVDWAFLSKIDFLYENRLYLSSFSIKFVYLQEYHKIFDQFKSIIQDATSKSSEEFSENTRKMHLILTKLNNFLTFLIDQKQSKYFLYWYKGKFLVEFLLQQRDLGIIILTLKVLFKLLKSRNKNTESIRVFFDDLFEPFLGFIFAINCGPLLGQFSTLNADLLQDPSLEKGEFLEILIFRGKWNFWRKIYWE
jgi:hypothetical protein